jgi:hypothetical protein
MERSVAYLRNFLAGRAEPRSMSSRRALAELEKARTRIGELMSEDFTDNLQGSIGKDLVFRKE